MSDTPEPGVQRENLWPTKIQPIKLRPPVSILKEQASLLGQVTQNIVIAEVRTARGDQRDQAEHDFLIVAPALGNYRVSLFKAMHKPIELYPLRILSEILAAENQYFAEWEVKDEGQLKSKLKEIFAAPKTTQIIQSLLAQSEGYTPPDPNDRPF